MNKEQEVFTQYELREAVKEAWWLGFMWGLLVMAISMAIMMNGM